MKANLIVAPKDCDFVLSEESLVYEKEHIYEGSYELQDGTKFSINVDDLHTFANETNRYIANGNKSNLPVEHTNDPEKNRGHNLGFYVKEDSQGRKALFSKIKFRDEEAVKLASTAQTSIFAPADFKDGKGEKYTYPVKHVALTDYPVVPGLDGFTPIAASLVSVSEPPIKETEMPLKDLAAKIGLQLSEGQEEEGIVKAFKDLQLSFDAYKKANPETKKFEVSDTQVEMLQENRGLKLSNLVENGKITPAVKKRLECVFSAKERATLCLSQNYKDDFNDIIEALAENDITMSLGEKSGAQTIDNEILELSQKGGTNPLLANAEARKEAFNG